MNLVMHLSPRDRAFSSVRANSLTASGQEFPQRPPLTFCINGIVYHAETILPSSCSAFAALTEEGHESEIYELTGPELLTFEEVAVELSRATGSEIRFQQIPHADFMAGLRAANLSVELTGLIGYLFTEVLDGRNQSLADGVQRALGRPPRRFADYARDAADAGSWIN